MMTAAKAAPNPRHVIVYVERPGVIASCGILGCGWLAFYPGRSVEGMRRKARENFRKHLETYHGVTNPLLEEE